MRIGILFITNLMTLLSKMKILITVEQMMRVLESEPPKFPITIVMKGLSKAEVKELTDKIEAAQKKIQ